jgi:rubrerythrin
MRITTVTKMPGGKAIPIGMTVVPPERRMGLSDLEGFGVDEELEGIFLANFMSAFAAHERCVVHLYRMATGLTRIPECREKYTEFEDHTEDHLRILERLIERLDGDPMYASPQARMTEFVATKLVEPILLEGSVDPLTLELTLLEAVTLAERKRRLNLKLISELADQMRETISKQAMREAVEQVESDEDEHVRWAETAWLRKMIAQVI